MFALRLATLAGMTAIITSVVFPPTPAHACGGCFAPPETITTVDSHRMVISLSPERSVLWDQIRYTGNPKDFVWVLPLPSADVTIEIADSEFFDEIEFQTAPRIQPSSPPIQPCFGCCASAAGIADDGDANVIIYDERVVGPYETVIIGSESADALQNWLVQNSYRVPESTVPIIDHYVALNSVFAVLRLAPGEGIQSMEPVRISFEGYMATFPLKMVTVGAAGTLELTLWVIAEQRYEAWNYANATIDQDDIVYDWDTATSNYPQVFLDTIDDLGGRAWITEYAAPFSNLWFTTEDDVAQINRDLPGASAFITRLRTSMLIDHLDEDLMLVPAEDSSQVSNILRPGEELNRPFGDDSGGCEATKTARGHVLFLLFIAGSLAFMWRRRRKDVEPSV